MLEDLQHETTKSDDKYILICSLLLILAIDDDEFQNDDSMHVQSGARSSSTSARLLPFSNVN
jgi:hypothetical protein